MSATLMHTEFTGRIAVHAIVIPVGSGQIWPKGVKLYGKEWEPQLAKELRNF
jgi:hypothetical protein